jgi:hypothetical protein
MLEYFYPNLSQQDLLSPAEKAYLQSQKAFTANDETRLGRFATEVASGFQCEFVQEGPTAHVVCYQDEQRTASLIAYGNMGLETQDRQRFRYSDGLQRLRELIPQIRPFELRTQCANNLRSLWYRLRLYWNVMNPRPGSPSDADHLTYPEPETWCDKTVRAFTDGPTDRSPAEPYRCPSAGEGRCHYALNPSFTYSSPADTVLLFETKPGWNQHGGPELFTFDNHDPRGGLVLLNDGTVKFIRTEEELKQLRWK